MKALKELLVPWLLAITVAAAATNATAQNGTGRFNVQVEPAAAAVCFWLDEWRCEADIDLQVGSEYFVYASADGYESLNDRVVLNSDGQLLQLTLQSADGTTAAAVSQTKPDGQQQDEAPRIAHSTEAEPVAGQLQSFSASVVDETAVERVTLHYRSGGEPWKRLQMNKTGLNETYMATVEAEPDQPSIEYFISALDITGNESRVGDLNSALTREIAPAQAAAAVSTTTDAQQSQGGEPVAPTAAKKSSGRTWLWIGLGVLAAGAVAVAASGGDDGGDDDPTGTFTLNLTPPTQ